MAFKANGESHKQLMEMIINRIDRVDEKVDNVTTVLRKGEGKIAVNRTNIESFKLNMNRLWWVAGTYVTINISILIAAFIYLS